MPRDITGWAQKESGSMLLRFRGLRLNKPEQRKWRSSVFADKDCRPDKPAESNDTMGLKPPKSASELLDLYYHDMRSHLLEVAAAFDRIERAGGAMEPRLQVLRKVAAIAVDDQPDRAVRFLEALSE